MYLLTVISIIIMNRTIKIYYDPIMENYAKFGIGIPVFESRIPNFKMI